MMFLAIALGFVGVILAISGVAVLLKKRSYDQCAEPVTATVVYKHAHSGKNGKVFELQVAYTVDGREYKKYIRTNGADYNSQNEGSQIELLYKPGNPKQAIRPLDGNDAKSGKSVLIAGAVLIVAGVILYFVG